MREFDFGDLLYCVSADAYDIDRSLPVEERYLRVNIKAFTRRPTFRRLRALFEEATGLSGTAVLSAHGGRNRTMRKKKDWTSRDGERRCYVQSWIDRMDGQAASLMVLACNGYNNDVHAEDSLVFHPGASFKDITLRNGSVPIRLFVPGEGYVEDSYTKIYRAFDRLYRL